MGRLLLLILLWPGVVPLHLYAQAVEGTMPGKLLVMLHAGADPHHVATGLARFEGAATGLRTGRQVSAPLRAWTFHFDTAAVHPRAMLRAMRMHPMVQLAQFDHAIHERAVPDDPGYGQQWHHQNIQSEAAWDFTTGGLTATGDTIVVCIIERVDLPHPDLIANAWYNHAEIPGNGIDDDGNGYVDDHRGWNVATNNDEVYNALHGTRVAGMVGARGNNAMGVAGASWNVKMMVVHYGSLLESNVVAAYSYPLEMRRRYNQSGGTEGAFVVATNASWGINNGQPADHPIWCAIYDSLGAEGVLSCGATANSNVNVDVVGDMPTACSSDFLVSVTSTNSEDMRGSAGYGPISIDVAAPGSGVYTTTLGGGYGTANGTSFASPLTAGVIGLMYAAPCTGLMELVHADPAGGASYVREMLFAGVDQVGNLPGTIATGGRINAGTSLQLLMGACGGCPAPFNLQVANAAIGEAQLSWSTMPADSFLVQYRPVGTDEWTSVIATGATLSISGLLPCTAYEFQVAAYCAEGESGFGPTRTWVSEGCCHVPPDPVLLATTEHSLQLQWGAVLAALTYDLRWRLAGVPDWTDVPALTGTQHTLEGLEACAAYQWQVRTACNGEFSEWSATFTSVTGGCGACVELVYCPSGSTNSITEWIESFHIGGVDLVSGNDGGYGDHTGVPVVLGIGVVEPFTMVPGFSFSPFTEWTRVWIDLDRDGIFNDADELLFDPLSGSNTTVSGNITIPSGTVPGITRLRVSMKYQSPVESGCTPAYQFGETEDHCVDLQPDVAVGEMAPWGGLMVYPQPADQEVFFRWPDGVSGPVSVSIGDAAGRSVASMIGSGGQLVYPTGGLAPGVYHYQCVNSDGAMAHGRFVVAR